MGGTSGGMSLDDVNVVVGQSAGQVPSMVRVAAGSTHDSYLWHKVSGTQASVGGSGGRMPFGGSALPADELAVVESWINAGALP